MSNPANNVIELSEELVTVKEERDKLLKDRELLLSTIRRRDAQLGACVRLGVQKQDAYRAAMKRLLAAAGEVFRVCQRKTDAFDELEAAMKAGEASLNG